MYEYTRVATRRKQDLDVAPSLVACDDNDTVLRTLVYFMPRHVKRRPPFLFFFLLFFISIHPAAIRLCFNITLSIVHRLLAYAKACATSTAQHHPAGGGEEARSLSSWHSWANFHFTGTWHVRLVCCGLSKFLRTKVARESIRTFAAGELFNEPCVTRVACNVHFEIFINSVDQQSHEIRELGTFERLDILLDLFLAIFHSFCILDFARW